MVRNQQQEAEQKRRLDAAEKKARTRAELQQKIIKENQRRLQIEVGASSIFNSDEDMGAIILTILNL